mmetsp:Transcript_29554/g.78193  ORF Transcript_29554/g.78193 Transcript_29554/m.78193 type:complete len:132 (+) Transcript_29554:1755-2150(+)
MVVATRPADPVREDGQTPGVRLAAAAQDGALRRGEGAIRAQGPSAADCVKSGPPWFPDISRLTRPTRQRSRRYLGGVPGRCTRSLRRRLESRRVDAARIQEYLAESRDSDSLLDGLGNSRDPVRFTFVEKA